MAFTMAAAVSDGVFAFPASNSGGLLVHAVHPLNKSEPVVTDC